MNILKYLTYSFLLFSFAGLKGQDLHLDSYLEKDLVEIKNVRTFQQKNTQLSFLSPQNARNEKFVSPVYLPEFARKNPTGYTYLCRLELQIEKDLPLGLWLDIGDNSTTGNPSNANANVRFRFKLK